MRSVVDGFEGVFRKFSEQLFQIQLAGHIRSLEHLLTR